MKNLAPIALFVFNRPEHTRRTLSFLQKNRFADESRLFIFSDAAKAKEQEQAVKEVRDIIAHVNGFKSVKIIQREHNIGLANSIISGVTDLVNEYGKVIVFEDDLISSPYTLEYFNHALELYQNEDKVMHIGAYMYPLKDVEKLPETFFYRVAHSWGWATWKRAWDNFNPDIDILIQQFDRHKIDMFSIEGKMNFWKQVKEFKAGKNNSWAIRWYASMFLKGGLSLNPSKSLINNIGTDGTGVHSQKENMYHVSIHKDAITQYPEEILENPVAYQSIKLFLSKRKGSLLERVIRYTRNHILKV